MSNVEGGKNEMVPTGNQGKDIAPIENPHDLMGEALKRLHPEKVKEILGKAAEKALDLQAKKAEAEIDHHIVEQQLDAATKAARRSAEAGTEFQQELEHRSEHGYTRATIKTAKPQPPAPQQPPAPPREVRGSCFVATACFGDYEHPTVVCLRQFRDLVLLSCPVGRWCVSLYYRVGPGLATVLNCVPFLKVPVRGLLTRFSAWWTGRGGHRRN